MLVRSVETCSTQSKVSLRGSASSTRRALADQRLEIGEVDGATIGATVRRCAVWPGGSIRMKFGSSCPWRVGDLDAAEFRTRRIVLVIELDRKMSS